MLNNLKNKSDLAIFCTFTKHISYSELKYCISVAFSHLFLTARNNITSYGEEQQHALQVKFKNNNNKSFVRTSWGQHGIDNNVPCNRSYNCLKKFQGVLHY